ncbi:DNA cytosine methyltransferase [Candidatus Poriferisodalis sp.]|uniref:DNA cytosine methyltransferase n=1 Tax=Candidatus Poriferisodalis sp. TaxID=3101277 RepID=UPI003D0F049A
MSDMSGRLQEVTYRGGRMVRTVEVGGYRLKAEIELPAEAGIECSPCLHHDCNVADEARADPLGAWWKACLAGAQPRSVSELPTLNEGHGPPSPGAPAHTVSTPGLAPIRTVDLFCGVGGLTAGVAHASAEIGRDTVCEAAVDADADALAVFGRNHRTRRLLAESVLTLVDYRVRGEGDEAGFVYPPELLDESLAEACAGIDLVVAGPPCQGHSNLNNHTRRSDRRNHLYLTAVAFAVAANAEAVVIENVTSVVHDRARVVDAARALLAANGYGVTDGVLAADGMGWPQTRKRHFLVARRSAGARASGPVPLPEVAEALMDLERRSVTWAIGGNQRLSHDAWLHEPTELTDVNRERIRWLFENDEHDLALRERPDCHRNGTTYGAAYGRIRSDQPAPTITTGYTTPGRGRYVHPTQMRTLNHAEAARLQGFADTYCFEPALGRQATRAQLAKWIGNAVTVPLGYAAALSALLPH